MDSYTRLRHERRTYLTELLDDAEAVLVTQRCSSSPDIQTILSAAAVLAQANGFAFIADELDSIGDELLATRESKHA